MRLFLYMLFIPTTLLLILAAQAAPRDCTNLNDKCCVVASDWYETAYCKSDLDRDADGLADPAPPLAQPADPITAPTDLPKNYYWYKKLPNWRNSSGEKITCFDGTQPGMWIHKAVNGSNQVEWSNKWLVYLKGGGSCWNDDDCWDEYTRSNGPRGEMSTAGVDTRYINHDSVRGAADFKGILHTGTANDVFHDFNKVVIYKCGYDRFAGTTVQTATPAGAPSFERRQMGFNTVKATLLTLKNGATFRRWDTAINGMVAEVLPAMADADQVVIMGSSGGAHGLMLTVDRFVNTIKGFTRTDNDLPFSGEVGAIIDSNFMPSLDGEDTVFYDFARSGTTPSGIAWDDALYQPGGTYDELYQDYWETPLDQSCLNAHPIDSEICMDRHHVLGNHMTTPAYVIQDHWDPNPGHCSSGSGYVPDFAQENTPFTHDCGVVGDNTVYNEFGDLVDQQALDIAVRGPTQSELAVGPDSSGPVPTRYFISTLCGYHEILKNDFITDVLFLRFGGVPPYNGNHTIGDTLIHWLANLSTGYQAHYTPRYEWETYFDAVHPNACPAGV